jgi:hypothetical protein
MEQRNPKPGHFTYLVVYKVPNFVISVSKGQCLVSDYNTMLSSDNKLSLTGFYCELEG